jgi:hypothetical protein
LIVPTTVTLSNAPAGAITYNLGDGAPAGASVSGNGIFYWTPTPEQGSTTNSITVWAVDNGTLGVSNSVVFTVTVGACVKLSIGSAAVQTGNTVSVPITVFATVALNNVSFSLATLTGAFTNWTATATDPLHVSTGVWAADPSQPLFSFSGQVLPGTNVVLGTISVQALPTGVSAFAQLTVTTNLPTAIDNSTIPTVEGQAGKIAVVGVQPLLDMTLNNANLPAMTLYGNPGSNYVVMGTSSLTPPVVWTPMTNFTMSTISQPLDTGGSANQMAIFQVVAQ